MAKNYTLNWSSDTLKPPFTLAAGTLDTTTTSLALTGRGHVNWGERLEENLLHLLEHFASPTAPSNPTIGQQWFNSTTKVTSVWYDNKWNPIANVAILNTTINSLQSQLNDLSQKLASHVATAISSGAHNGAAIPPPAAPPTAPPSGTNAAVNGRIGNNGYGSYIIDAGAGRVAGTQFTLQVTVSNMADSTSNWNNVSGQFAALQNCSIMSVSPTNSGNIQPGGYANLMVTIMPTGAGTASFTFKAVGTNDLGQSIITQPNPATCSFAVAASSTAPAPAPAPPPVATGAVNGRIGNNGYGSYTIDAGAGRTVGTAFTIAVTISNMADSTSNWNNVSGQFAAVANCTIDSVSPGNVGNIAPSGYAYVMITITPTAAGTASFTYKAVGTNDLSESIATQPDPATCSFFVA